VAGRASRLVNHEPVAVFPEGDHTGDGRVPVVHDDGVAVPHVGEVLAQMGLKVSDLSALHDL